MTKKFISYSLIAALLALCVPQMAFSEGIPSADTGAEAASEILTEPVSEAETEAPSEQESAPPAEEPETEAAEEPKTLPYDDVPENAWFYNHVSGLYFNSIAPENEHFYPDYKDLRGNFVYFLYMLAQEMGEDVSQENQMPFSDVGKEMYYYMAVSWAAENGIISGTGEGRFMPETELSNEQVCLMLMRFASKFSYKLAAVGNTEQFYDSLRISPCARSAVSACKIAGIINGDDKNCFYPQKSVTRAQSAYILYNFLQSIRNYTEGEAVNTADGAYDYLYDGYIMPFTPLVAESEAVDLSYFDDAVFIGDSVTVSLQYYCAASGALGSAQFLASTSLSQLNAESAVTRSSFHPSYRGVKMKVEDAVAASGAKKVYIMLGINCLRSGAEYSANALVKLIDKIKEKSPDAVILIESTTPMTDTSNIKSSSLNNNVIDAYNAKLLEACDERGWYFINVAEAVKNASGSLNASYCSDKNVMGIHFNYTGDEIWVNYLKTHVPQELK